MPGAFGARDLQVLVVDDLWPSSRTPGADPGNAPGVVLAYRIGEGSSSQVVASFGAWNSDGGLSWAEPVVVSSGQGENEAFGLARGQTPGTVQLVLQKREPSSSPQELLAQFRSAPQEVINEKLDALATGARTDSDLYQSTLTIVATGQDGYSLQQSTKDYKPTSSANTALTLESDQQPTAPPAAPSGGNTLLSRAALAANAAPAPAPAPRLLGSNDLLGAAALPRTGVTFATASSTSSQGGGGFSGPPFNKSGLSWRSSLTAIAVPWRYELGSKISDIKREEGLSEINDRNRLAELENDPLDSFIDNSQSDLEGSEQVSSDLIETDPGSEGNQSFSNADSSEENDETKAPNRFKRLESGGVSVDPIADPERIIADPFSSKGRETVFKGLFGGLLAGRGGYSVANFSTLSIGKDARSVAGRGLDSTSNPISQEAKKSVGYDSGFKFGVSGAGSLQTFYQYSSPNSGSDVNLLSFTAKESVGIDFSVYRAKIYDTGTRVIVSGSLDIYLLLEQKYSSDNGLPEWLQSIGLATGIAGDALSLSTTTLGAGSDLVNRNSRDRRSAVNPYRNNGYGYLPESSGVEEKGRIVQNSANAIGLASAALSIGTIIGAASSNFNQYGTASFGFGSQQVARLRALSKYGYGIEAIIGAQENTLWDFSGNPAGADEQILAFGSAGAALAFGGYIPLLQASWKWNSKPSTTSSTELSAPAMALAAPAATPPNPSGSYEEASTGISYPMGYAPAFATDAFYTTPGGGPLASLTSTPTNLYLYQLSEFAATNLNANALTWTNTGTGPNLGAGNTGAGYLNDGDYTNVPLIGLLLPGSATATASFTVTDGSIVQESFSVQLPPAQPGQPASGQYLALPQPTSGNYTFGVDVFQPVAGNPPPPLATDASSVHAAMPLFNIDTNSTSVLAVNPIARIQQQISLKDFQQIGSYLATQASASTSSKDSKLTSYANVAVVLNGTAAQGPQQAITTLNPGTATVNLVNGKLISVILDQPLYFTNQAGYSYSLVPDLATALDNTSIVNPSLSVTPQLQGLADFTDQYSFTANPTASNAGVYLSAGLIDTLPLLSSYGQWPVQNRVTYVEGANTVYLNTTNGKALTPSDPGLIQSLSQASLPGLSAWVEVG